VPRDPRSHQVDPAWVWSPDNPGLELTATLRVTLTHPEPGRVAALCDAWFATVQSHPTDPDTHWQGGAGIQVVQRTEHGLVLLLSSGGQDAYESLDHTVREFCTHVVEVDPGTTVLWEQLPLG